MTNFLGSIRSGGSHRSSQIGNNISNTVRKNTGFKKAYHTSPSMTLQKASLHTATKTYQDTWVSFDKKSKISFTPPQKNLTHAQAQSSAAYQALLKKGWPANKALEITASTQDKELVKTQPLKKDDKLYAVVMSNFDRSKSPYWMTKSQLADHVLANLLKSGGEIAHDPETSADALALPADNQAIHIAVALVTKDCDSIVTVAGPTDSKVAYLDDKTGAVTHEREIESKGGSLQTTPEYDCVKHIGLADADELKAVFMEHLPFIENYLDQNPVLIDATGGRDFIQEIIRAKNDAFRVNVEDL
jgi:hypothetical protein